MSGPEDPSGPDSVDPYQAPKAPLEDVDVDVEQRAGSFDPSGEWVVARTFSNLVILDQTRTYLEQLGYEVQVKDDHTLQADPVIAVAIGGARLMVRAEQAEAVGLLLEERFGKPDLNRVRQLNNRVKRKVFWWFVKAAVVLCVIVPIYMILSGPLPSPADLVPGLVVCATVALILVVVYFMFIGPADPNDVMMEEDEEWTPSWEEEEEEADWIKEIEWGDDPVDEADEVADFGWGSDSDSFGDGGDGGGD